MTRHFLLLPLGTTMIGADQLAWLLQITCASRSLFHSLPSYSVSWQWGMASVRQVMSHLCQSAF